MNGQEPFQAETLAWLLEEDDPGVRYLALRDLVALPAGDAELLAARDRAHRQGPIAAVLDAMEDEGYWAKPGPGYNPKYRSTVWAIILLGQLGASVEVDGRIDLAGRYLLDQALTEHGQLSMSGAPSGTVDCLQGNLCAALLDLGFDSGFQSAKTGASLETAFDWLARSVTGEGIAPFEEKSAPLRYYAGKRGPGFLCGANDKQPCAWGAIKVVLALGKLPPEHRTPLVDRAVEQGLAFLLGVDPATAAYPSGWNDKPSGNWWKFGFPVFYVTDLLQNVEALLGLGCAGDPRLANALQLIRQKQDAQGRWPLEYSYTGKTWVDFGPKKQPNKWVTLRAARVLKQAAARP
jgi:hypothetical protein